MVISIHFSSYANVHVYLSIVICGIGIIANTIHVSVLLRPTMRASAVNRLLALMACCDICTMTTYTIFNIRFGILAKDENLLFAYRAGWVLFLLIHVVSSIAFHTTSLYICVATAYIRYHALDKIASRWMMAASARPIFIIILSFVAFTSIPTFLVHGIEKVDPELTNNESLYTISITKIATANHCLLFKTNLWLTGIFFKIIPCILLLFFTIALFKKLKRSSSRRSRLRLSHTTSKVAIATDRTTKILSILLLIYLSTELPQGAIAILNGLFPSDIHHYVYIPIGEMLDILSLINCYVCFIVYPCISTQYRGILREISAQVKRKLLESIRCVKISPTSSQ